MAFSGNVAGIEKIKAVSLMWWLREYGTAIKVAERVSGNGFMDSDDVGPRAACTRRTYSNLSVHRHRRAGWNVPSQPWDDTYGHKKDQKECVALSGRVAHPTSHLARR